MHPLRNGQKNTYKDFQSKTCLVTPQRDGERKEQELQQFFNKNNVECAQLEKFTFIQITEKDRKITATTYKSNLLSLDSFVFD